MKKVDSNHWILYSIIVRGFLKFLVLFLAVALVAASAFAMDFFKRNNLVVPRTVLGNMNLSGMTRDEVREVLREKLAVFSAQEFQFAARGIARSATLQGAGISINESAILDSIPFAANISNAQLLLMSFAGKRVMVNATIEQPEILRLIDEKFPEIPKARNAHFILERGQLKIAEAGKGLRPSAAPFIEQLKKNIAFLEFQPLFVEFEEAASTISVADLEQYRETVKKMIKTPVTLKYEKYSWKADFNAHPEWLQFERKPYEVAGGEVPITVQWDPVVFSNFVNVEITQKLEQAPEDVRIWREESTLGGNLGAIQFEGRAIAGQAVERQRLLTRVNNMLAARIKAAQAKNMQVDSAQTRDIQTGDVSDNVLLEVEIPLAATQPKVEVSPELSALGISELIAVGHTRFQGSPANRIHNIGVGISKFNGLLIPPNEIFSFGDNLGIVDSSTGYRKELVIKPEGTIPEYGGGLCQVSTTMYRAALNAGLPITERHPHSFAVTYYSQVGGHGLDATIYPPSRDLKFLNDTPGHILIQSYVDGMNAYFKFYGTLDERKVALEGPAIWNRRSPPEEPFETIDPKLPAGERKQVGKPQVGFDARWYRYITKGGKTEKEEIFTRYDAVPAKFMVGEKVTAPGENTGIAEETE